MNPWYCTREAVKAALDIAETARANAEIDRNIDAASRSVESQLNRRFYPTVATRYFDWPPRVTSRPWVLDLYQHELISLASLTAGGVAIPSSNWLLEPVNDGPPYDRIEINLGASSAFSAGATYQRAIAGVGVWGYRLDSDPAGTLAAAISSTSATTCSVTDSASVGVGDLLTVDTERTLVSAKNLLTTGQTLQAPLTASATSDTVAVTTGAAYTVGEVLTLDSERMLVVDIAGNNLIVERAWDGSRLAAHTGSTIYAPRTLTLVRGVLGTTAATHSNAAAITRQAYPGPVRELALAEALNLILQKQSGYARTISAGDMVKEVMGRGLADIRAQAYASHGRKVRGRAV